MKGLTNLPLRATQGNSVPADARSRDAQSPVVRRSSARDAQAAASALAEAYCEVTVLPNAASDPLRLEVATCELPNVTLGRLWVSELSVRCEYLPLITVCLPIAGEVRVSADGRTTCVGGQSAVVISAGGRVAVDYMSEDSQLKTLGLAPSAVEEELTAMLGTCLTKPLRFDGPFSWPSETPFFRAWSLLRNELRDPDGLLAVPAMSARLGRLVIAGLLVTHAHNYSGQLATPTPMPSSKAIRSALEFIENRSAEIVTVADIAGAVGLSARALNDGFQRHVGTPPMSYLRQVRMQRVHADLVAADPDATTATAVARRWGFGHYGRFAAAYRDRFGRKPSETLRGLES